MNDIDFAWKLALALAVLLETRVLVEIVSDTVRILNSDEIRSRREVFNTIRRITDDRSDLPS